MTPHAAEADARVHEAGVRQVLDQERQAWMEINLKIKNRGIGGEYER